MITIAAPDCELRYWERFFSRSASDRYFTQLEREIAWQQDEITLFGKTHLIPRLSAWYGDPGCSYTYSGIRMEPLPWTPTLLEMKTAIAAVTALEWNSVLLNFYRHGQDSMGWHSDDEPALGKNPAIASVSLGGIRRFQLRHKHRQLLSNGETAKLELELQHGSLLLMQGPTQHFWQHQVPKTAKPVEPRINLTFRKILVS